MVQLCHAREALERVRATVLVISLEGGDWAERWREQTDAPFPLLIDRRREVYRAYGLERSLLRSWSPRTLLYYFRTWLAGGQLHGIQGDPHQLGGDFIIDQHGIVRLAYRSQEPTDRPPVDRLLAILERSR